MAEKSRCQFIGNSSQKKAIVTWANNKLSCAQRYAYLRIIRSSWWGSLELHSVKLASWLREQKVYFAFRQKKTTYIKGKEQDYQQLSQIGLTSGSKLFLTEVTFTLEKGFGQFNLAAHWLSKSKKKTLNEGWYILTNLDSLNAALQADQARSGIERSRSRGMPPAMFRDCQSGGYNERRL